MYRIKSLRQLRTQLTGVRLSAADTSLWSIGATINERARIALNDALGNYPITVRGMYHSVVVSAGEPIVLPPNIKSVVALRAKSSSMTAPIELTSIRHVPTAMTNLLYINHLPFVGISGSGAEMETIEEVGDFTKDLALVNSINATDITVDVSGGIPDTVWVAPGYFELSPPPHINTIQREVVQFFGVSSSGFFKVVRGVIGTPISWAEGSVVSCARPLPPAAEGVIQKAAQANMYEFWMAHQAQYDQYTAAAGIQQLDIGALLALIRSYQADADRRYKKLKVIKIPPVTQVRRRAR